MVDCYFPNLFFILLVQNELRWVMLDDQLVLCANPFNHQSFTDRGFFLNVNHTNTGTNDLKWVLLIMLIGSRTPPVALTANTTKRHCSSLPVVWTRTVLDPFLSTYLLGTTSQVKVVQTMLIINISSSSLLLPIMTAETPHDWTFQYLVVFMFVSNDCYLICEFVLLGTV